MSQKLSCLPNTMKTEIMCVSGVMCVRGHSDWIVHSNLQLSFNCSMAPQHHLVPEYHLWSCLPLFSWHVCTCCIQLLHQQRHWYVKCRKPVFQFVWWLRHTLNKTIKDLPAGVVCLYYLLCSVTCRRLVEAGPPGFTGTNILRFECWIIILCNERKCSHYGVFWTCWTTKYPVPVSQIVEAREGEWVRKSEGNWVGLGLRLYLLYPPL